MDSEEAPVPRNKEMIRIEVRRTRVKGRENEKFKEKEVTHVR